LKFLEKNVTHSWGKGLGCGKQLGKTAFFVLKIQLTGVVGVWEAFGTRFPYRFAADNSGVARAEKCISRGVEAAKEGLL